MKKQIWKFEIKPNQDIIEMPKGAKILTVQNQNGNACIWALVDPENEKEKRHFEVFGTGHNIHYNAATERKYINTFQLEDGRLVFHLFERIN